MRKQMAKGWRFIFSDKKRASFQVSLLPFDICLLPFASVFLIGLFTFTACSHSTSSNRTTVTFWHGMESGVNNKILQAKIDAFNAKHPDIFVDAQVYGAADQLGSKLDAAVAGKTPPDLLWWSPAFFPKYAEAGALRNIDEFITEDVRNDVYDYLWELGTFQGKRYLTPFSANNLGIYYNKKMLAEAMDALSQQSVRLMQGRGLGTDEFADRVFIRNLRGGLQDIVSLGSFFRAIERGRFRLIVLVEYKKRRPDCSTYVFHPRFASP